MNENVGHHFVQEPAQAWIERTLPRCAILGDSPSVLLIEDPDERCWVVASRLAADAIANPCSFLGGFMRSHAALLTLRYLSNN